MHLLQMIIHKFALESTRAGQVPKGGGLDFRFFDYSAEVDMPYSNFDGYGKLMRNKPSLDRKGLC